MEWRKASNLEGHEVKVKYPFEKGCLNALRELENKGVAEDC